VKNPKGVSKGIKSISINGREIVGNVLPILPGKKHTVKVVMG